MNEQDNTEIKGKKGQRMAIGIKTQVARDDGQALIFEAQSIAENTFVAFCDLADKHKGLIKQFWETFQDRAQNPFLSESRVGDGLAVALEEFLGKYPDKYYLNFELPQDVPSINVSIKQIKIQCRTALQDIALQNPCVLQSLQEVQEENQWLLQDTLRALFAEYVDKKDVYPY